MEHAPCQLDRARLIELELHELELAEAQPPREREDPGNDEPFGGAAHEPLVTEPRLGKSHADSLSTGWHPTDA